MRSGCLILDFGKYLADWIDSNSRRAKRARFVIPLRAVLHKLIGWRENNDGRRVRRFTFTIKSPTQNCFVTSHRVLRARHESVLVLTYTRLYTCKQLYRDTAIAATSAKGDVSYMHHAFSHPSLSVYVRSYLFRLSICKFSFSQCSRSLCV